MAPAKTSVPRVLILGATGRVGGATLKALANTPELTIRATARSEAGRVALKGRADEVVAFDFDDPGSYDAALDGVDRLFLLTGYSVDMLHQSKHLIDRAKAAGIDHIVHLGTHAPDDTVFKHHAWHQLVERFVEWHGFGFTHLRPAMFMVNILDYARANRDRPGVLVHYTGDAKVAWVDTDDVGEAAANVLRDPLPHNAKTYFLDAKALSMAEVAAILSDEIGSPWRFEHQDAETLMPRLQAAGREMTYASSGVSFFKAVAEGKAKDIDHLHDHLHLLLGQEPTSWRDFARRNRDAFGDDGQREH